MWRQVSLGCLAVAGVSCASASSTVPPPAAPTVALTTTAAELPHDSVWDLPPQTLSTGHERPEVGFAPPASGTPDALPSIAERAKEAAVEFLHDAIASSSQTVDAITARTDRQSAANTLMVITVEVADPTGEFRIILVEVALSRGASGWSVESIELAG